MFQRFAFIFIALALIGAPFGMGRMMDAQAGVHAMHSEHTKSGFQHHAPPASDHAPATPHFALCAACVASMPQTIAPIQLMVLNGLMRTGSAARFAGIHSLPPTPPPRA